MDKPLQVKDKTTNLETLENKTEARKILIWRQYTNPGLTHSVNTHPVEEQDCVL